METIGYIDAFATLPPEKGTQNARQSGGFRENKNLSSMLGMDPLFLQSTFLQIR